MRWRWKWDDNSLTRTQEGNAKRKRKKREHQHQHTWPEAGKPWKGKEKSKSGRTTGQKTNQRRGGRTEGREPKPTSAREGPKPDLERGSAHEIGDQWGPSWWKVMHPQFMQGFVIRLKGPRYSSQNPLDSWRVQPLNYVHNWTSPTTIKGKSTIPASMSSCLIMRKWLQAVSWAPLKKKIVGAASDYRPLHHWSWWSQEQRAVVQPNDFDRWESKKGQQFTLLKRITNSKV